MPTFDLTSQMQSQLGATIVIVITMTRYLLVPVSKGHHNVQWCQHKHEVEESVVVSNTLSFIITNFWWSIFHISSLKGNNKTTTLKIYINDYRVTNFDSPIVPQNDLKNISFPLQNDNQCYKKINQAKYFLTSFMNIFEAIL